MNYAWRRTCIICLTIFISACAGVSSNYDYSAYHESNPRSILVLPPLNSSPDVHASYSMLSTVTYPLAESGYYVFPVALVDQMFKENGLQTPGEMHQASLSKLREIFGADAILYITVTEYGASFKVLVSEVRVTAEAKLVDARTGRLLWSGRATASDEEGNNNRGGLAELVISAVAKQVISNVGAKDRQAHVIASRTSNRLLMAHPNGLLYGPRSPMYGRDGQKP